MDEGEVWAGVKATRQADAPQKLALFSASIFQHEEHDGDDLRASSVIALRPFLLLHSHHLHLYLFLPHDFPLQLFLFSSLFSFSFVSGVVSSFPPSCFCHLVRVFVTTVLGFIQLSPSVYLSPASNTPSLLFAYFH